MSLTFGVEKPRNVEGHQTQEIHRDSLNGVLLIDDCLLNAIQKLKTFPVSLRPKFMEKGWLGECPIFSSSFLLLFSLLFYFSFFPSFFSFLPFRKQRLDCPSTATCS